MLDYLKTVEGLTVIRDEIRLRLEDENRDRQSVAEFAEASLTQILSELVTPDDAKDEPVPTGLELMVSLLLPIASQTACPRCGGCLLSDCINRDLPSHTCTCPN